MTQQEAIKWFEALLDYLAVDEWNEDARAAANLAIEALRGPQPDPITGLVPCGCGCNPELRADDWGWYQVYCTGCDMHGGNSHTPDNVTEEWNEAMGWRADE